MSEPVLMAAAVCGLLCALSLVACYAVVTKLDRDRVRLEKLRAEVQRVLRYDPNPIGDQRALRELRQQYHRLFCEPASAPSRREDLNA